MANMRVQRRLAAILAADIVGYSRLMSEDEETTLTQLKGKRSVNPPYLGSVVRGNVH